MSNGNQHGAQHGHGSSKQVAQAAEVAALTAAVEAKAAEAPKEIARVPEGSSIAAVIAKVNELVDRANAKRDRGPESTRTMTEEDAKRIMLGDLKDLKHNDAAKALGLSYGQVYSARKGFTFKGTYKESAKSW